MPTKTELLTRLAGGEGGDGPAAFLPDLTLWHTTHLQRGTLPERWQGASLVEVAADLGVTAWEVTRPWRLETPGIEVETSEDEGSRSTCWRTRAGELTARWTLGPDGSWWQTEYPVRSPEDFGAALELASARRYVLDPAPADTGAGDRIVALELPTRPYADLLYDMVGMSDGLILLAMGYPEVGELLQVLEGKLRAFLPQLLTLPADVAYSPDNLDRQFIAPAVFDEHLADGYAHTVAALGDTPLVVHAGGPVRDLLAPLSAAGVRVVEGICGPAQSDATLAQARQAAGDGLILWGGIAQDALLPTHDRAGFETAVAEAAAEARADPRAILGVADRVPVDADLERLEAIAHLL